MPLIQALDHQLITQTINKMDIPKPEAKKLSPNTGKMRPRTKMFLDKLATNPTMLQADAWLETHDTVNRASARATSTKVLARPSSQIYLAKHVQIAKQTIVAIAMDKSAKDSDRLKASQDVLDRTVGKAIQKVESTSVNTNINIEASQELNDQFTQFLKQSSQL